MRLMNRFGKGLRHSIVTAQPGAIGAAGAIDRGISYEIVKDFPSLVGGFSIARYQQLARAMKPFDLILTYNWGAMDAVMAHTIFGPKLGLPPLVHHEDGFNEDEAVRLKWQRNLFRMLALARASALVVPSQRLEQIALKSWRQPRARIHRIANGVDVAAYQPVPAKDAVPRIIKHEGEFWVGTLAGLRPVKNLPRLVRAFARLPDEWQLVMLGQGPEEAAIRAEASRLGIDHRVHLPGFVADPASVVGLFDIFALSSDSEQFPLSVVEAMAAGVPIVSPAVGDVAQIVSAQNLPYITPAGDEAALAKALDRLADDADLRNAIGEANRAIARDQYDAAAMQRSYAAVYARAMRRASFP